MHRAALLLLTLFLFLGMALGAAASEPGKIPPPKLQDVRIWYYPPGKRVKPVSLLWWQPGGVKVQRRIDMSRKGCLRVRVVVSGGFEEDEKGNLLNWTSIVFRDDNTNRIDLPHEMRATANGIKDIYWRYPANFVTGPLEVEVAAWAGRTPVVSLNTGVADRTNWFQLGRVVD